MSEPVKPRWGRYEWSIRYKGIARSDFALFTAEEDAEAFLTLLKLMGATDSSYEIARVEQ